MAKLQRNRFLFSLLCWPATDVNVSWMRCRVGFDMKLEVRKARRFEVGSRNRRESSRLTYHLIPYVPYFI